MRNDQFRSGDYTTKFIEETPELFNIQPTLDRGTKTLEYIGNVTINGFLMLKSDLNRYMKRLLFLKYHKQR